jgi:Txe/YoeB family toxin of Txe-Axe toxin-antitoxin module
MMLALSNNIPHQQLLKFKEIQRDAFYINGEYEKIESN